MQKLCARDKNQIDWLLNLTSTLVDFSRDEKDVKKIHPEIADDKTCELIGYLNNEEKFVYNFYLFKMAKMGK